jgi:hypothetical protein
MLLHQFLRVRLVLEDDVVLQEQLLLQSSKLSLELSYPLEVLGRRHQVLFLYNRLLGGVEQDLLLQIAALILEPVNHLFLLKEVLEGEVKLVLKHGRPVDLRGHAFELTLAQYQGLADQFLSVRL